jgi:hypothetical protein
MSSIAHIEHRLPGRVRLRVPSKRGDLAFFERVVKELSRHPAVWDLVASPLTGSITLQYSEPLQAIMEAAVDLLSVEPSRPEPRVTGSPSKREKRLSRDAGLAGQVAGGLSGLCIYQALRGKVVGNALESFWLSFSAQTVLSRPDLAAVYAGLGVWQLLTGRLFGSASSLFFYSMVMRQVAAVEEARARGRTTLRTGIVAAT